MNLTNGRDEAKDCNSGFNSEAEIEQEASFNRSFQSDISDIDGVDGEEDENEKQVYDSLTEFMSMKPISKDKVLLTVMNNSNFYLKGKILIKVIKGSVEVLGHTIFPSSRFYSVYSPRGYSLLDFRGYGAIPPSDFVDKLMGEGVSFDDAKEVTGDCVLILRKLSEGWTKYLHSSLNSKTKINLLQRDKNLPLELQHEEEITSIEKILDVNFIHPDSSNLRLFQPGEDWDLAISSMDISRKNNVVPRLLVAGGKGVGKSTFLRWLTNKLLFSSPVVFLDLDPGQAELSLPGYLSLSILKEPLLGPNFSHTDRPAQISLCLGDVNVSNCPARFLECVTKLITYLNKEEKFYSLPVVVNTMGWCRGIGLMLLIDTIRLLQPSTVVQLYSRFHRKNYPFSLTQETVTSTRDSWSKVEVTSPLHYNLLEFLAVPESRKARDMRTKDYWGLPDPRMTREMVVVSALGKLGGISNIPVIKIPFNEVSLHVCHTRVEPQALLAAVNLAVVDICEVPPEIIRKSRAPGLYSILKQTPLVPSLGFGVIRNIDVTEQVLYVSTCVSPHLLKQANCLVAGSTRLPDCVLFAHKLKGDTPYLALETENPLDLPWQRNFKPRGHTAQ